MAFDALDDYINAGIDSSIDNITALTLTAWIKLNSVPGTDTQFAFVTTDGSEDGDGWSWKVRDSSGVYVYGFAIDTDGTNLYKYVMGNLSSVGAWTHFAVVWNGSLTAGSITLSSCDIRDCRNSQFH